MSGYPTHRLADAMREAREGSYIARLAVTCALDGAPDWPQGFRGLALRIYNLPDAIAPDDAVASAAATVGAGTRR